MLLNIQNFECINFKYHSLLHVNLWNYDGIIMDRVNVARLLFELIYFYVGVLQVPINYNTNYNSYCQEIKILLSYN